MKPVREVTVIATCLRPRCGRPSYCRGLCRSDYQQAHRFVSQEITSWETLEKHGKCEATRPTAKQWFLA